MAQFSDLSFIEMKDPSNPIKLFLEWKEEAVKCGVKSILMNLATATKSGQPRNRTITIREIMPDAAIAFTFHVNSAKMKEISENPQVAATILFTYNKGNKSVSRQVRIEGTVEKLPQEQCKRYYDADALHAKIRGHICRECRAVDWKELKKQHDKLLKDVVEKKKKLEMPETEQSCLQNRAEDDGVLFGNWGNHR